MRYLAIEIADCSDKPICTAMDDLIRELEANHPIVVNFKQVVLDQTDFKDVEKLS